MVRLFPTKLVQSLLTGIDALQVQIYRVEYLIVGNATLNDIILLVRQAFTAD